MVTISIEDIHEEFNEDQTERSAYVVEYSIPQYSGSYRTEPIAAEEFDRETAIEEVKSDASVLVGESAVTVQFPEESDDEPEESVGRRNTLKYGAGILAMAGILGGGGWLTGASTQILGGGASTPTPTNGASVSTDTATPADTQTSTPEKSPTTIGTPSQEFSFVDDFERDEISRFVPIDKSSIEYWSIGSGISGRSLVGEPEGRTNIKYDPSEYGWTGDRAVSVAFLADTDYSKQHATLIVFDNDIKWSVSASVPLDRLRLRRSNKDPPKIKDASIQIEAGEVHRLTIEIRGASLVVKFNGNVAMEHTHDTAIEGGTVGLGNAHERLTYYDDLRIKNL